MGSSSKTIGQRRRAMSKVRYSNRKSESDHEDIHIGQSIIKKHETYKKEPMERQPSRPKIDTTVDRNTYSYEFTNDSMHHKLDEGSVVHDREWHWGLINQASIVQCAVAIKAKCTFSFRGGEARRTLNIIDDMGVTHGTLVLAIAAGAAHVSARPLQEKIHFKKRHIRVPQGISQPKRPIESSTSYTPTSDTSYTEVVAQQSIRVPKSKKSAAQNNLKSKTKEEADRVQSQYR